jgi:chaperonin cofactor prefoldin
MRIHSIMCAVLIVGGAACASSQAEEVKDARIAQVDEQTVSKTRVIEDRQEAREHAIERKHDTTVSTLEASKDDTGAAEQMAEVAEDRASYESDVRARWETIGVRINAAQQKMDMLGRKTPKLQTELKAVASDHDLLKDDIQSVPSIPSSNWENATDTLDEHLAKLNERVKELTETIEDADHVARK